MPSSFVWIFIVKVGLGVSLLSMSTVHVTWTNQNAEQMNVAGALRLSAGKCVRVSLSCFYLLSLIGWECVATVKAVSHQARNKCNAITAAEAVFNWELSLITKGFYNTSVNFFSIFSWEWSLYWRLLFLMYHSGYKMKWPSNATKTSCLSE